MAARMALAGLEWTGSALRGWGFDDDGEIVSEFEVREAFEDISAAWRERLNYHVAGWLGSAPGVPVIACGELARPSPASGLVPLATPLQLSTLPTRITLHAGIHLVPWVGQGSPPDLTCGAETILFGLGDVNGAVCIAGHHTRHARLEHGRLVRFTTELTSELRDLLLSHGTLARAPAAQAFDMAVFQEWIERALDAGQTTPVFAVEAARLQGDLSPANKAAALAGLMIGADVATHYSPGDDVLLVADGPLLEAYSFALDALGADVEETSAIEAVQEGLFELADLAGLLGGD